MSTDTIAAYSTPPAGGPGRWGIGRMILRLSGPEAIAIASRVFAPADPDVQLAKLPGHRHLSGQVRFSVPSHWAVAIDANTCVTPTAIPATLYLMRAPRSYTREDLVELHLPAAPALAGALLQALCRAGARPAEPGEFTRRAYLAGRLSLDRAEAVARMVAASTASEQRLAARRLLGLRSSAVAELADRTAELAALLEAALDFSDEDIEVVPAAQARDRLEALREQAARVMAAARSEARGLAGARVALAGRPNAGKSSLLNRLTGRPVAIVSAEAGTTRDRLEANVSIRGADVLLVDTAGLETTAPATAVEVLAREVSLRALSEADILLWVHDGSVPAADSAARAAEVAAFRGTAAVLALNKSDLGMRADAAALEQAGRAAGLPLQETVRVSALCGEGLDALEASIVRAVEHGARQSESGWELSAELTAAEAAALERATDALDRARAALAGDGAPNAELTPHLVGEAAYELAAADLREALAALSAAGRGAAGTLTDGGLITEAVLDRVFSQFCIGK